MDSDNLRRVVDFHDASQVIYQYALHTDNRDMGALRALFLDDAVAQYTGMEELAGADHIVAWITEKSSQYDWQHHLLSVYQVEVDGDDARTFTYHTSHQTHPNKPAVIRVIVGRYRHDLRRTSAGWRIAKQEMFIEGRAEIPGSRTEVL